MRIVHVANANYKYLGLRTYGLPIKINNGFIRNGHDVYLFSERDIARASNIFGSRKFGVKSCNKQLIQICKNFQPEAVVLSHADLITTDSLDEIRQLLPYICIIQYNIDALFIPSNLKAIQKKVNHVDHTFVTTAGECLRLVAGKNTPASFIPNPVDPSIDVCKNHIQPDLPIDIFFAAALNKWVAGDDLRATSRDAILECLPELECEFHGNNDKIWGSDFRRAICQSKIGLNFSLRPDNVSTSRDGPLYLYSSDRISLYMGNGLLTYVTNESYLSELYGEGVVSVGGVDELIDSLRFYTINDDARRTKAKEGYEFSHNELNERLVSQFMLDQATNSHHKYNYVWPVDSYHKD